MSNERFGTRMIWRKGWIEARTLGGGDASEKWMITRFTSHHTKPPPNMEVLPKTFLQIILAAKCLVLNSITSLLSDFSSMLTMVSWPEPEQYTLFYFHGDLKVTVSWDLWPLLSIHPILGGPLLSRPKRFCDIFIFHEYILEFQNFQILKWLLPVLRVKCTIEHT